MNLLSQTDKRTDYHGREIARLVQNKWDNFTNEIQVVIGDEWFAGNLSYHLISRPKWMLTVTKPLKLIRRRCYIYWKSKNIKKYLSWRFWNN